MAKPAPDRPVDIAEVARLRANAEAGIYDDDGPVNLVESIARHQISAALDAARRQSKSGDYEAVDWAESAACWLSDLGVECTPARLVKAVMEVAGRKPEFEL